MLIALMALLPMSGEAQTISRNKKTYTTKTPPKTEKTTKSKQSDSSNSGGKSKKPPKTTSQQSSSRSKGMTQAQKKQIIQQAIDDMVFVEGGTFSMGLEADGTHISSVKQVTLSSFYICKYEVTQELWQAVMDRNPSIFYNHPKNPVECVSWDDCQTFISKLNKMTGKEFRLPTEEEWEYAARGGKKSQGYKYAGSNDLSLVGWYDGNSGNKTHAVGTKLPNELGIFDMSGNVYEWCSSRHSLSRRDPAWIVCVYRGGSWFSYDCWCEVWESYTMSPSDELNRLGLRLAANTLSVSTKEQSSSESAAPQKKDPFGNVKDIDYDKYLPKDNKDKDKKKPDTNDQDLRKPTKNNKTKMSNDVNNDQHGK